MGAARRADNVLLGAFSIKLKVNIYHSDSNHTSRDLTVRTWESNCPSTRPAPWQSLRVNGFVGLRLGDRNRCLLSIYIGGAHAVVLGTTRLIELL